MIQCNEYGEYEVAKGVPSRLFAAILVCQEYRNDVMLITEQCLVVTSMCGQCRVLQVLPYSVMLKNIPFDQSSFAE